jgi:type II secretory pathway predicted ATPase ExeA
VIEEIFQQAKGIPRVINNLCYACLVEIYQQNKSIVDTPTLEKVLIQWDLSLKF